MSTKRIKHSKYKNTGLIFEFLVRQLTVDVLEGNGNSKSLSIIKKFFKENTEIGKEIQLYQALMKNKYASDKKADFLITETAKSYNNLNSQQLKRDKYNLIKMIKENYDIVNFMSSRVPDYKAYASVYKLFESYSTMTPTERTEIYFNILEHITTKPKSKNDINLATLRNYKKNLSENEDLRILTYRTLLEKFNEKYSDLNNNQKSLLRAYINNLSNNNSLSEYITKKIPSIKSELNTHYKKVTDQVTKIKLKESISLLDKFKNLKSSKSINDQSVISLMRYYELLKEFNKE